MGRHDFSEKVVSLSPSATVSITDLSKRLKEAGVDVFPLGGGSPDYDTPLRIKAAAKAALDLDYTYIGYTDSRGIKQLREAVATKLARDNGIVADPTSEIIITIGGKEALYIAFQVLLRSGDEVLIPDPGWVSYEAFVRLAGGVAVPVPALQNDKFHARPGEIEARITSRTRAILLNSPCNPTGAVYRIDELRDFAEIAVKHDLWVVSDEIYEYLVYGDAQHHSIGSLPGMEDRTITVNGFSKAYAMTGWRVGYVHAPAALITQMLKVHQHSVTCAAAFAQMGAVAAIQGPQEDRERITHLAAGGRQVLLDGLSRIPGVTCVPPEGGIFCFPDFSAFGYSSDDLSKKLLSEAGVATTPGKAFGDHGEGYLRMAFARRDLQMLHRAVEAIREVVGKL